MLVLALLQGVTEFLPISSSGHLVLLPLFADWIDRGISFDVAVHVGTLVAVISYFRKDIRRLLRDWFLSIGRREQVGQSMLAWSVFVGTIPAGLCGFLLNEYSAAITRSSIVIAITTIGFGLLLGWVDWRSKGVRSERQLRWSDVIVIGLSQVLALIPGTSRSGITMTAAIALGLTREAAARFSFLLGIPLIAAAGMLKIKDSIQPGAQTDWGAILLGAIVAGLSAYVCIHYFLRLIPRIGLLPFALYRVVLGLIIIVTIA